MKIAGNALVMAVAALAAALATAFVTPSAAQPYCAYYENGTQACGIPTLQSCEQSLSGVGGYCGPDQQAAIPPNFLQREFEQSNEATQERLHPQTPGQDQPGGLNWMPPPPQESK